MSFINKFKRFFSKNEIKSSKNNIIDNLEPGFNYFQNKNIPTNFLEIYADKENDFYFFKEFKEVNNLKQSFECNKKELSDTIEIYNFNNIMGKVSILDISELKVDYKLINNTTNNNIDNKIKDIQNNNDLELLVLENVKNKEMER